MARLKWDNSYSGRGYQIDKPSNDDLIDDEYIDPKKIKVKKSKSSYPFPSANSFLSKNQSVIAVFKTKTATYRHLKRKKKTPILLSEIKFQGRWRTKDIEQFQSPVYITFEETRLVKKCNVAIREFEKTSDGLLCTLRFTSFTDGYFHYDFLDDYKIAFEGKSKDWQITIYSYQPQ